VREQNRQIRIAQNQVLFREVNEHIDELMTKATEAEYICECGNDACVERVRLSHAEYHVVRSNPLRFFVAPNGEHVFPDVERIVETRPTYWVVEKSGPVADVAAEAEASPAGM
jgi:hypothetical protein